MGTMENDSRDSNSSHGGLESLNEFEGDEAIQNWRKNRTENYERQDQGNQEANSTRLSTCEHVNM